MLIWDIEDGLCAIDVKLHLGAREELATWQDIHQAAKAIIDQCVDKPRAGGLGGDHPKIGKIFFN